MSVRVGNAPTQLPAASVTLVNAKNGAKTPPQSTAWVTMVMVVALIMAFGALYAVMETNTSIPQLPAAKPVSYSATAGYFDGGNYNLSWKGNTRTIVPLTPSSSVAPADTDVTFSADGVVFPGNGTWRVTVVVNVNYNGNYAMMINSGWLLVPTVGVVQFGVDSAYFSPLISGYAIGNPFLACLYEGEKTCKLSSLNANTNQSKAMDSLWMCTLDTNVTITTGQQTIPVAIYMADINQLIAPCSLYYCNVIVSSAWNNAPTPSGGGGGSS